MKKRNVFWIFLIILFVSMFAYRTVYHSAVFYLSAEKMHWDVDFWHTAGTMWLEGKNPYLPDEFGPVLADLRGYENDGEDLTFSYPPQMMLLFSALSLFPVRIAAWLLFGMNLILIFVFLYLVSRIIERYHPIGLPEIAFLAAMLSTGIRTNIKYNQLGLIIGCAIIGTILLALQEKDQGAGLTLGFAAFKPTSAPLLMFYFLLKKIYRLVLVAVSVLAVCGLLAFALTSLPMYSTIMDFAVSLGYHNVGIDDPSPFVPTSATQYQLQVLLLRLLNSNEPWAYDAAWIVVAGLTILIFWLVMKPKKIQYPELFDFAVLSTWTMLVVYHRSYEVFLLIPALVYLYLLANELEGPKQKLWATLMVWGLLLFDALPSDLSNRVVDYLPDLAEAYLFRVAAPVKVWWGVVILAILILINLRGIGAGQLDALE